MMTTSRLRKDSKDVEPLNAVDIQAKEPTPDDIARRAYQLYQERGNEHGSAREDWLQAERESVLPEAPLTPLELLVRRIRAEYDEMPGLSVTFPQACRLWQVDTATCQRVLDILVGENFLARRKDGSFIAFKATRPPSRRLDDRSGLFLYCAVPRDDSWHYSVRRRFCWSRTPLMTERCTRTTSASRNCTRS